METVYSGKVWKFGDKISTDFMVPGAKVLANPDISPEEAARFCMHANRPDWAGPVDRATSSLPGSTSAAVPAATARRR